MRSERTRTGTTGVTGQFEGRGGNQHAAVHGAAWRVLREEYAAQDVCQEVYRRLWQWPEAQRVTCSPAKWGPGRSGPGRATPTRMRGCRRASLERSPLGATILRSHCTSPACVRPTDEDPP